MENIYKCGIDESKWHKISQERFLELTEGRGYFDKGTALKALEDLGTIRTDWSFYKSETEYLLDKMSSK